MSLSSRRVAVIGARGVANYGGFETFVAELGPRLVDKGFEVYCSQRKSGDGSVRDEYLGMKIIQFPLRFPRSSKLARIFEILYDWYFALKCAFQLRCDVVFCLGVASGFLLPVLRLSKAMIVVNVDGIEWRRQKFSPLERTFVKMSFLASCVAADRLILDNLQLRPYVLRKSSWKALCIPYGARPLDCPDWNPALLTSLGVKMDSIAQSHGYWLVVSRLEPDNSIHMIVEAYLSSKTLAPLVIVGSYSTTAYETSIDKMIQGSKKAKSVLFTGSIFDSSVLDLLRCHCRAYIHGHSVGGTNPSLLEAMSAGNIIVAHDNVFNREVCSEDAFYFGSSVQLSAIIDDIDVHSQRYSSMGAKVRERAATNYQWSTIATLYEQLFRGN
ncbi:MAG TPA: DUF1972 domain-containing protein [Thermoplasmata archaeon]